MFRFCTKKNVVLLAAGVLLALYALSAAAKDYEVEARIPYSHPDGSSLKLTLYLPKETAGQEESAAQARPAILLIHGGAWLFGTRHQLAWYGKRLAREGYVAAALSYRLMPRHPFPACLHDCKAAVRWLRLHADEYGIDPGRIAVLGNSAGGHLASLLATTTPEDGLEGTENPGEPSDVVAAVSLYGVADMSYYRQPEGWIRLFGFTRRFVKGFVGEGLAEDVNPYDQASPAYYADRDTAPILFIHGTNDGQVPCAQSVAFCEHLRRQGVPARLITVPFGHAFDFFHPKTRRYVYDEIREFLASYLLPAEGDPATP